MLNILDRKFISEKGVIILSVKKPEIPEFVRTEATKGNLIEKAESHISIAVTKTARQISEEIEKNKESDKLKENISSLLNNFSWKYALTNEYFLHENFYTKEELVKNGYTDLTEHSRRSIVQLVNLPDIELFYKQLNDLLGTSLSVPVPHVTLFSWSDYEPMMLRGIGISSKNEFDNYTKKKLIQ
jgi:hypothetical protein